MRLPHHSGYLWRCSLKIKGEKEKLCRLPIANMPFYIVYSKANCTTNSLQACNKAVLLFGVVLAKVKYPATKIIRYVENHPEKKMGNMGSRAACSLTQETCTSTNLPGARHFSAKSNQIFRHYSGVWTNHCMQNILSHQVTKPYSSRMNSVLSASNGIIRGPVASSSII